MDLKLYHGEKIAINNLLRVETGNILNKKRKLPQKASFYKTPKDKNFKRERFNSEGANNNQIERIGLYRQSMNAGYNSNPNFFDERIYSEDVKVDPSKVKYSLKSILSQ